jgi:hypothetical protein
MLCPKNRVVKMAIDDEVSKNDTQGFVRLPKSAAVQGEHC